ncbi:MAG: RecQ family ATP-dependent DNA helicase, partial [Flavobacteriales bacterium]|nr:RecQ family ATP-dependent DNA helicase [Flavobacteriales bacterium]
SLCFQAPALAMGRLCLVISPLIALMKDQVEALRARGVRARALTSELSRPEIDVILDNAALGKLDFLYVAPERLGSDLFTARLHRLPLGLIAVDEAHCISQWGYDFRPAYQRIAEIRKVKPEVPVIALTASATPTVAQDIMEKLAFRAPNMVHGSFVRPELVLWVDRTEDRMGRLIRIAQRVNGTGIVYMRERKATVRIAETLQREGISAKAYHAGLTYEQRDAVQASWMKGGTRVVVATNAFGMGIDKPDVRFVVHLEPPPDLESYYQEAGRAGRDGQRSFAVLLTQPHDPERLREKVLRSFPEIEEVRRVYQSFSDMNRIALGSGALEQYPVDLRGIAARTGLSPATVSYALKALELDGALVLSEGARSPSRVFIQADHHAVNRLRSTNEKLGPVLECLLRLYGGMFEEAAIIEEDRVAQQLKWSTNMVMDALRTLQQQGLIIYHERSDGPSATLLVPRRDAQRLMLERSSLDARKERAVARAEAMLTYTNEPMRCRTRILLDYFGEPLANDCGQCDRCRGRATRMDPPPGVRNPDEVRRERWQRDEDIALLP